MNGAGQKKSQTGKVHPFGFFQDLLQRLAQNLPYFSRSPREDLPGTAGFIKSACLSLPRDRESFLVVTHESSRTGAPRVALELARQLKEKGFTVVTLSLLAGALDEEFQRVSDLHLVSPSRHPAPDDVFLSVITSSLSLKGAFVNSVAGTAVLPALARARIPTVMLIHEYLSTFPHYHHLIWPRLLAGSLVFSTEDLKKDGLDGVPAYLQEKSPVYAQGLSRFVRDVTLGAAAVQPEGTLARAVRPPDWDNDFVVLGAGSVTSRKGVDLFFATALHLARLRPGNRIRFVWIGKDPTPSGEFSLLLRDQLKRSGLGEAAVILGEVEDLTSAYRAANVLYLSSRLDPLPLVAQEALAHGLPVVCFDQGNGIAAELKTREDLASVVVPYLDTEAAANVLGGMAENADVWIKRKSSIAEWTRKRFDFSLYAEKLLAEVSTAERRLEQEARDTALIGQAGVLDGSFLGEIPFPWIFKQPAEAYVRGWAGGGFRRKPFPGFHPGIYAVRNGVKDRDPLAHFLEAGKPAGPWSFPVIRPEPVRLPADPPKVGLHLHVHYEEQVENIRSRLEKNVLRPLLWITVNSSEARREVERVFAGYPASWEIIEVPNRGRDIGPLLTGVGPERANGCEIIGHVHTKKTVNHPDRKVIEAWCHFLWENVLGGQHAMLDRIVAEMSGNPSLGLVFPEDSGIYGWGKCREALEPYLPRMGLEGPFDDEINFPVGSFFWARPRALEPLWRAGLNWEDYPQEPLPICGTLLHGIERLFPLAAAGSGYEVGGTHIPGVCR